MGSGAGYAATTAASDTTRITFHQLALHGQWQGDLKFGVNDGVVYLAGNAGNSDHHVRAMVALPPGDRPTRQLDIAVTMGASGTGLIQVLPDGTIWAFTPPGGDFTFVSLDGVSFPLGS